ncbi:YybH family protein [Novipirellula artificiosorum]|uniref:SnoaL-like domain protein n=1 Tax=Novipirellula artificiosorum TaxID=2528016 RepID=A0A5C6DPM7_9BACT|nr:nuclear transport factor 2 family protein [Novipirellula artificiosorum]TWU39253.1 SnoaL-like domain protein [Novipirellula artificiosorum]
MGLRIAFALLFLPASVSLLHAQENATSPLAPAVPKASAEVSPQLDAIRGESQAFVDAVNRGDAKAVAEMWTSDAHYIDDSGQSHEGRAAIEQAYAAFFEQYPGIKLQVAIDSLRLVGEHVAIEDGRAKLDPAPDGSAGYCKYTAVHVKEGDTWQMASVRESWVEAQATPQNIADFDWLIGTWVCEEHGVRAESVFRWVADESFIQRTYTTTAIDGTTSSGTQMIGWNPLEGHLQSWDFSPGGGHAIGVWSPVQSGWVAEMIGMTGDGVPTRSVNLLARLDANGCVWQSTQRVAGDVALPDTDEVVMKRKSEER